LEITNILIYILKHQWTYWRWYW